LSAVALVAMVLAAIAAFTWQANRTRNRQRMALAAQQVEEDLSQATGHIRADDIPRAWVAWNRAAARDGLDASSELAAARDQLKRDLELTEELDRIRLERLVNTGVDLQTPFTGYETAFTNAGFQLWTENEASLVEKLNGSAVRNALTLAIHDWALICELNIHHAGEEVSRQQWKDRRNRLLRIAGQANSDRKLDPIYEPTKWDTPGAMDQYAQQLDAASLSSHLLLLVGLPLADEAREALWRRGQLSHPNDFWINASLASLFDRRGLNDQAVEFYRTALAVRPDSAPLLNNLGRCLHEIERLDEALVCLTRAVEIDPKSWNAYANLGLVFTAREEFDEAARNYQTSIRLHPDPRAWNNLAQVYRSQGDRDAALRALDEAFQLSPEIAEPHANLAAMLEEEGRLDEARERYYRAYRINPELPGLRESLANLFCDAADDCASRQDWSAAIGHLQKSIEVEPTLLRAHIGLAEAHRLSGDLAAAISGYREILRIEPKQADIHYRLGLALAKQHDYEAAAQSLRETLKLNPEAAAVHRLLGITLSQLGRYDEALPHLQESVQSSPNDTDVHVGLGKALCELGRFRESLDELERAQQLGIPDGSRRAIASRWVNEVSRLVELEGQLPKIMSGEIRPQDASEAVSLATLCYHKKRFARSAELFEAAFSSYPETSADVYSNDRRRAIYAAAMAGVGQTESDAELDETARRRWRDTSREWARQCLASYVESLDHGADEARTQIIRRILRQWRQCVELAGVRDADQVVNLTTDERHAWNLFWRDVEAVIDRSARSDIAVTQKNP
jgi:tetratricopeptide (TPR) repeat protein